MAEPKFCTVANVAYYAGANCNTTSKAEAAVLVYGVGAESYINAATHYNWSDAYAAGLNVDVKSILSDCQACIIAMYAISYDMSGFTSRIEAETMLDFLSYRISKDIDVLLTKVAQEFMIGAI